MPKPITASDRTALIKLASELPKGSDERKAILSGLKKAGYGDTQYDFIDKKVQLLMREIMKPANARDIAYKWVVGMRQGGRSVVEEVLKDLEKKAGIK
jgi:hypothetical protein